MGGPSLTYLSVSCTYQAVWVEQLAEPASVTYHLLVHEGSSWAAFNISSDILHLSTSSPESYDILSTYMHPQTLPSYVRKTGADIQAVSISHH